MKGLTIKEYVIKRVIKGGKHSIVYLATKDNQKFVLKYFHQKVDK